MSIYEKLRSIQICLKAPKGQYNSFGKYKYRSCEDILEAVKPLLVEHGVTLTISDNIRIAGNRHYIEAVATVTDGEDLVSVTAYAREDETKKGMDGSQITGTASSYARKYALNGLFLIDDTKDADTEEHAAGNSEKYRKPVAREEPKPKQPSPKVRAWNALLNAYGGDREAATAEWQSWCQREDYSDSDGFWQARAAEMEMA